MTNKAITIGKEYAKGFVLDHWECHPAQCVIKIQGTLNTKKVTLKGLVNVGYTKDVIFNDSVLLEDGDSVWCEPDGLVVLRSGGTDEQIEPINDMKVQIGVYFDKTFLAHPTVEA